MKAKQIIPPNRFLRRMTRSSAKETDCSLLTRVVVHNPTKEKKKTRSVMGAEEIQSSLNPKYPSFIKIMLPSHVSNGFWLNSVPNYGGRHIFINVPTTFCSSNLPKVDIDLTLLDEDGEEHTVKCLPRKFGLSGGWGPFARAHKLAPGDAVVFHLVEATKFKVYIVRRTRGLACDIPEEGSHIAGAKQMKTATKSGRKRVKLHPSVPILGEDRNVTLPLASNGSKYYASTSKFEQPDEHSREEVIDSEVSEHSVFEIQDVTSLESFTVTVNGLIIDSKISANVRTKYYELCRSQKTYLYKHLIQGLNYKLVAGIICETVNIADGIRACKLSTPKDEYKAWEKSLIELSRLDILLKLALESEHALNCSEQNCAKEELSTLEKKILELRNESTRLEKEVKTLKVNAEKHEAFHNKELATLQ
ncbi:hypothetical protein MKX01_002555 [Papaver californicum]|nr:hypothetical protein MKX01_002555 [Papaver californicum]